MNKKNNNELKWNKSEEKELIDRVLNLRDDQIVALYGLVKIIFDFESTESVIKEIKKKQTTIRTPSNFNI